MHLLCCVEYLASQVEYTVPGHWDWGEVELLVGEVLHLHHVNTKALNLGQRKVGEMVEEE